MQTLIQSLLCSGQLSAMKSNKKHSALLHAHIMLLSALLSACSGGGGGGAAAEIKITTELDPVVATIDNVDTNYTFIQQLDHNTTGSYELNLDVPLDQAGYYQITVISNDAEQDIVITSEAATGITQTINQKFTGGSESFTIDNGITETLLLQITEANAKPLDYRLEITFIPDNEVVTEGPLAEDFDFVAEFADTLGGCGDVYLFAGNEADTIGFSFWVNTEPAKQVHEYGEAMTFEFDLNEDSATAIIELGTFIHQDACDDAIEVGKEKAVDYTYTATSGNATLTLTPEGETTDWGFYPALATLQLNDVVFSYQQFNVEMESFRFDEVFVGWLAG